MPKRLLVVVEDENNKWLEAILQAKLEGLDGTRDVRVEAFQDSDSFKSCVDNNIATVCALVFDSWLFDDRFAGCDLFRKVIKDHKGLREYSIFHTAFDHEVAAQLIESGELSPDNLIDKGVGSIDMLIARLEVLLSPTPDPMGRSQ